jgi:Ca2+-binding RTX toxin-like protein
MGRSLSIVVVAGLVCAVGSAALAATKDGGGGPDRLVGTKGNDVLRGFAGADVLSGGRGHDRLVGRPGPDVMRGGPGYDELNMADGAELESPGRDRIVARDGGLDQISCGAGRDVALVDAEEDGVYDCERVIEP